MEADSFSLKLTLSVLAKEDYASCQLLPNGIPTSLQIIVHFHKCSIITFGTGKFSFAQTSWVVTCSTVFSGTKRLDLLYLLIGVPLQVPPCSYACVLVSPPQKVHHKRNLLPNHKNPIKCHHNNIHLMELEKYNKVCLAFNFTTRWSCATTNCTSSWASSRSSTRRSAISTTCLSRARLLTYTSRL